MKLSNLSFLLGAFLALSVTVHSAQAQAPETPAQASEKPAQTPQASKQATEEKVENYFKPQQGTITLKGGLATLNIPSTLGYLDPAQSKMLLEKIWNNPEGSGAGTLGMIVPYGHKVLSQDYWGIVITYSEDGYVKDNDAEKIDYKKLLTDMQESTKEESKERVQQGYSGIELVGWAEPPHYDKAQHKLYWAKELKFADTPAHGLNYDVRILGRHGVLVLTAVAGMDQLGMIAKETPEILAMVNFNEGKRYADFDPTTDKVATYGLAALVAGGLGAAALKGGLLKGLIVMLLAAKKFIVLALVAVAAFFKKLFGGKKNQS